MPRQVTIEQATDLLQYTVKLLRQLTASMLEIANAQEPGEPLPIKRDHLEVWRAMLLTCQDALTGKIEPPGVRAGPGGVEPGDPVVINDEGQAVKATTKRPATNINTDEDLAALLRIAKRPPVDIQLRADSALAIMAMLQLALRHPGTHDKDVAQKAGQLKDVLIQHLAAGDARVAELLHRGDDPEHDFPSPTQQP